MPASGTDSGAVGAAGPAIAVLHGKATPAWTAGGTLPIAAGSPFTGMAACSCGEEGSAVTGAGICAASGSETGSASDRTDAEKRSAATGGRGVAYPASKRVGAAPAAHLSRGRMRIGNADRTGDGKGAAESCHASRVGIAASRCAPTQAGRSTDTPAAATPMVGRHAPNRGFGKARNWAAGAGPPMAGGRPMKSAICAGAGSGASAS